MGTIGIVAASKKLPDDMRKHLAKELEAWARASGFVKKDGTVDQTQAAKVMGKHQGQISAWLNGDQWGADGLVALTRVTSRSINRLLGPTCPGSLREERDAALLGMTMELIKQIRAAPYVWQGKWSGVTDLMVDIQKILDAPDDESYKEAMRKTQELAAIRAKDAAQQRETKKGKGRRKVDEGAKRGVGT
jgi:hypothetical protein